MFSSSNTMQVFLRALNLKCHKIMSIVARRRLFWRVPSKMGKNIFVGRLYICVDHNHPGHTEPADHSAVCADLVIARVGPKYRVSDRARVSFHRESRQTA